MKLPFLSACILILFSCSEKPKKQEQPSFLIGNWVRTNDKKGDTTYEFWKKDFKGIGFTLKGKDTIFKEVLSIIHLHDALFLEVKDIHQKPTLFKFTNQTDTSFVCENSRNEFPKKITYFKEKQQLKAIVSSGDFKISFVFSRLN